MENGKDFSSMIAAAMRNPEQLMQINKILAKCNFDMNRKENLACNIVRVSEKEIWKNLGEVEGYEQYDKYFVSTFGRIKSIRGGKERILKPGKRGNYFGLTICSNNKHKSIDLHRIIAAAFVNNSDPTTKTQVNHINHISEDNYYLNLQWSSPLENTQAYIKYDEDRYRDKVKRATASNTGKPKHTEEYKRMLSEKFKGENNPMFGKTISEEHRRKLSEAGKLRKGEKSPLYGKPAHNKGIPMSEEQKIKISIAQKARFERERQAKAKLAS